MTTQTGVWLPNLWSEVLPIRTFNSVLGGNRKTDHHQIQHCFSRKQSHALPCLESTQGAHNAKHVITKFRSNSALCFPTGNLCAQYDFVGFIEFFPCSSWQWPDNHQQVYFYCFSIKVTFSVFPKERHISVQTPGDICHRIMEKECSFPCKVNNWFNWVGNDGYEWKGVVFWMLHLL